MRSLLLLLALAAPALAQEPTEQQKHDALLKAYHMNGDSMVRAPELGSIDLTAPRVIQTVPEMPVADPADKNKLDEQSDLNMKDVEKFVRRQNEKRAAFTDVCQQHGMHKVINPDRKGWRCKRL